MRYKIYIKYSKNIKDGKYIKDIIDMKYINNIKSKLSKITKTANILT